MASAHDSSAALYHLRRMWLLSRALDKSHARRKFYKALLESCSEALWFIGQMRQLYQLERELKDCSPKERRQGRLKKAPELWLAMKRRAEAIRADQRVLPQSSLGKSPYKKCSAKPHITASPQIS